MTDDNMAGLRATAGEAIAEIGRLRSALSLAKDRNQQAGDILKIGMQGTSRDEPPAAMAALTAVDEAVDQAIRFTTIAAEQLIIWQATL
jgi:hypothetical protein